MVKILTARENEIIKNKIKGNSLTQNESNILSKSIRPKLREINKINSKEILKKLEYNQKAMPLENKIRRIILDFAPQVDSITLCGSAAHNNYKDYNDVDIIIATKKSLTKNQKRWAIKNIENAGKKENLNLDIQIYSKKSILAQYSNNPSLIYQLKDSKKIYGNLKISNKINLSNLNLKMKLDWSEGLNINSKASEMYYALRNAMLILLLMNKKVDNYKLKINLCNLLGNDLISKLRNNQASKLEKRLVLSCLNLLINYLEVELKNSKWEKIAIENL